MERPRVARGLYRVGDTVEFTLGDALVIGKIITILSWSIGGDTILIVAPGKSVAYIRYEGEITRVEDDALKEENVTQFTEGKTYTATKGDNRFTGVQMRDHDYSVYLVQGGEVGFGASLFIPEIDVENWTIEEVFSIPEEPTGLGAVIELRNPKWIDSVFYVRGARFPATAKPWSNSFVSASWDTLTDGLRGDTEVIVRSEGVDLGNIS